MFKIVIEKGFYNDSIRATLYKRRWFLWYFWTQEESVSSTFLDGGKKSVMMRVTSWVGFNRDKKILLINKLEESVHN